MPQKLSYFYTFFYSWYPLVKVFALFNNYDLKMNQINITSFNSSTSPWAMKHDWSVKIAAHDRLSMGVTRS